MKRRNRRLRIALRQQSPWKRWRRRVETILIAEMAKVMNTPQRKWFTLRREIS